MSRRASRVSGFIIQIATILLGLALLTPIGLMVLPLLLLAWGIGWILWRVLRRFPCTRSTSPAASHVAGAPGYDRA
jgi:hypothetical protein